jgi:DNA-directed RNA polymerase specialized sigma subunit
MDYVYYSLPPKDQKIFEYMTGYGETAQLAPVEIAKRMGVSQSHISRRFAAMMNQLHDIDLQLQRTQ